MGGGNQDSKADPAARSSSVLSDFAAKDPSWHAALALVQKRLELSNSLWWLFRGSWNSNLSKTEFSRSLGFSRLNLNSLLDAAGLIGGRLDAAAVGQALDTLGLRFSSVVLGINYACHAILNAKPPSIWRKVYQEMMTRVEIGYHLGGKIPPMGVEGGALIGFAGAAGWALLMAVNPGAFKRWYSEPPESRPRFPVEAFGCEPYQVSAFMLQQLGYGHEIAIGAALASNKVDLQRLELDDRIRGWYAALMWVDALREGRNYPASPELRHVFPEVSPPKEHQARNVTLEVLYTEVAKVRSEGSKWTWHLPKPSYEETSKVMGI